MYEFIETETGWTVCWGPPPAELTRKAVALDRIPSEVLEFEGERDILRYADERLLVCRA